MFRSWSESEKRVMYSESWIDSAAWNSEIGIPVASDYPEHDLDFYSRLKKVLPRLAEQIAPAKMPSQNLSYSSAMLNVPERGKRCWLSIIENERRAVAIREHELLTAQSRPVKILTERGEVVSIIQGYTSFTDGGSFYPRGDKYTHIPTLMIDKLMDMYRGKARLINECKIYYNRDSKYQGNNLIFHWIKGKRPPRDNGNYTHWLNGRIIVDKIEEIKILLR